MMFICMVKIGRLSKLKCITFICSTRFLKLFCQVSIEVLIVDPVENPEVQSPHTETLTEIPMILTTGTGTCPHPLPMTDTGHIQSLTTGDPSPHPHQGILTSERGTHMLGHLQSTMVVDHHLLLQLDPEESK